MNVKQLYFLNNLKSVDNTSYGKNGSSKSSDLSCLMADTDKASENHFMVRLQEMEELNAHLEKLIEQKTKELSEVVATNIKFISIIAHDLRSPFSSILFALEIVKKNLNHYNKDEIEKYINIVSDSAKTTLNLLESLLEWAISQNEGKSFNPVKINLNELFKDEIESINTSAKQKRIILNNSITPNLNVSADLQMVKTIFRNLLSNAIKYTNNGGDITISASESNQFVEIVVSDTGIGISNEAQRNLFKINAFQSTAGTNNEKGNGLGLLLCKEFVELHGGNIRIESEPGKGSKFKFTLPHYI
jgi:two-component system, sensor histidine kinase and response regulator